MEAVIRHEGIVDSITADSVLVRIVQSSACSGCRASSVCHVSSESKDMVVMVSGAAVPGLSVGDRVVISGSESQGMRAVVLAFGVPLLLLVCAVVLCHAMRLSDAVAAGVSVAVLVLYFSVLALFRRRLKGQFSFEIMEVIK